LLRRQIKKERGSSLSINANKFVTTTAAGKKPIKKIHKGQLLVLQKYAGRAGKSAQSKLLCQFASIKLRLFINFETSRIVSKTITKSFFIRVIK